jgi:hypothetical protein
LYSNLQTRPLVREGATKLQNRKCLKEISRRKKNWSQVPDGRLTSGQTGRLTAVRKLTNCNAAFPRSSHGGQAIIIIYIITPFGISITLEIGVAVYRARGVQVFVCETALFIERTATLEEVKYIRK